MANYGAVVLAGGLARRMGGQDKGLIMLGGKPMVEWTLRVLKQSTPDIVINANRNLDDYRAFAVPVISDQHSGHLGPLAGLYSAMQVLKNDVVFMCPCDSPFIQNQLLERLQSAMNTTDTEIAVAHDGDRLQPVFAMVSRSLSESLNDFLNSGERKIDKWYSLHRWQAVDCSDCLASFRNINTEDERQVAELEISS